MKLSREVLDSRLKKYPGATYRKDGSDHILEYKNSRLVKQDLYDLWELFKRFNRNALRPKDVIYITVLDKVVSNERPIENKEVTQDLANNVGRNVNIKYFLYNEHTAETKGTIRAVDGNTIHLMANNVFRYVGVDTIISFKYIR